VRILHLVDRLTDRGGAYTHLRGVLCAQAEAGHEILLLAGAAEAAPSWPCPSRIFPGLDARGREPVDLEPSWREWKPDLVHVHTVMNPAVLEWAAARPAVTTVQDHRHFCPYRGKWTLGGKACTEPLARETCAGCFDDGSYFAAVWDLTAARLAAVARTEVTVLSRYMRQEMIAAGADPARVHVVPPFVHGLDLDAQAEGEPCVLFAGRLAETKGVLDAVEAWRRSGLGLPLVMAGTGPLREWAERAGAQVLGWVDHQRMAGLYRRAAALLMPSRWQEPFGIAGLEALTMGTPVAAWRSGGVGEWHPGGPALVPWGDVDSLAAALRSVAGERASAPAGFERTAAMAVLDAVYALARGAVSG
jgi:glycosyltransferase involved in cell wall biosynthesis